MRILYDSKNEEYKKPFGALKQGENCRFKIKIPEDCMAQKVFICVHNDITKNIFTVEMKKCKSENLYDIYSAETSFTECGLCFYYFKIITDQSDFSLYKYGYDQTNIEDGVKWQLTVYDKSFSVPDSFMGKVMYQIFPDRFYHENLCDCKDKLVPYKIHESTDNIPDWKPDKDGKILNCDFFGGNLKGIEAKLPYIKSLGTSIIYLNPIFKAYSNHRYDTCNYMEIDPLLGDENDFISLCKEAHRLNIKIVLDGVFSHTGSNSIYFDKNNIFGGGAYSNPNSKYKSWFNFTDYPDLYESWWGINTLPCTNELNADFLDYIINSENSVIAHWLNLGADGYRLDVADELPDEFILALRKRVKEIKPNSYVVGEVWEDASNKISYGKRRKYFSDGELDSVMNYCFKNDIISFVCDKISSEEFAQSIMTIAENYPPDSLSSLMNSLSTHDTSRILTCLSGADDSMDKDEKAVYTLSKTEKATAKSRLFIAAFLQYMLPGNACIYYGDEIGMDGFGDPFNRGYFKWNKISENILYLFKELGEIKNKYSVFKNGKIKFENTGDVLVFKRYNSSETLTAVVNRGNEDILASKFGKMLICHNSSIIGDKIYIQKGGFGLFI